jgi:RNA polymerase sigma-70 factor (ECF subfamily)
MPVDVTANPRPHELDDLALLRAAASGEDKAAATAFFKRFHGPVLAFLSRLVGRNDPDLDDLVQATFLSALDSAGRFEGRSQVRTWLFGIAVNKARTYRRGAGRRHNKLEALGAEIPARPTSPSGKVSRRELLDQVGAAVDKLSPIEREAFVLCDIEGVGGQRAAETLGVPAGTMWRRLHDARSKLRDALKGER